MKSVSIAATNMIKGVGQEVSFGRWLILGMSCALLVFAPLAYGAVHTWAYFPVMLAVAAMSVALLGAGLYEVVAGPETSRYLPYPPLWWLPAALGLLVLVQVLPWPQVVMRWLSPRAWEIRALGNGLGLAAFLPLSLNPYATLLETMKLWPAVVLFFILIYTVNSRRQILGLVWLILTVALFEVGYGFWYFRRSLIWGWPNPYSGVRLCGTFINSNHLAMFLAMAILLGCGLLLAQGRPGPEPPPEARALSGPGRWSRAEHLEFQSRRLLLLFLLLLLMVGLVFTGSRGGLTSLAVGFALMALLNLGPRQSKGPLLLMAVLLAGALLYSLFLGGSWHLARFHDFMDARRYLVMKGALAIFWQYPWLGSGIGTFGDLIYQYEPVGFAHFHYAHSDWLQLLVEGGLAGFLLLAAAAAVFFATLSKQVRQRRDHLSRYLGLGGLAALGAGIFHSLGEFPFHIPALSLVFAAIAAVTYLVVYYQHRGGGFFSYRTLKFPGRRPVAAAILLGLLGLQVALGAAASRYWRAEKAAATEADSTRPPVASGVEDFRRALTLSPGNSKYYAGLAEGLEKGGIRDWAAFEAVQAALTKAVFLSPGNWQYHQKLAEFYLRQQGWGPKTLIPQALKELQAAVTLFPESGELQFRLAAMLRWAESRGRNLVPGELQGASDIHLQKALRLNPDLKYYLR